jgi:hypothetical protein
MTDPTNRDELDKEFCDWFAQELAALETFRPIIETELSYEPAKIDRTGVSAKYLALEDELNRLYWLPIPENEAERDKIADQIIELEEQQFEITGPTEMCGTCCFWRSEWEAIVVAERKRCLKNGVNSSLPKSARNWA